MNTAPHLPDVASTLVSHDIPLDQVGMSGISLPLKIPLTDHVFPCVGQAAIFANVRTGQKGLHMSRMYQTLLSLSDAPLSRSALLKCAHQALSQQQEVNASKLNIVIKSDVLVQRPALNSDGFGWNRYPIELRVCYDDQGHLDISLTLKITYSSSCPASAALSRQALSEHFAEHHRTSDEPLTITAIQDWLTQHGSVAIPHSQRSVATLTLPITTEELPIFELITLCEASLGTAVQTYVKRHDEQAFALRNGANPMFVEDASRLLISALSQNGYQGHIHVAHLESLHGHDAVASSYFGQESSK